MCREGQPTSGLEKSVEHAKAFELDLQAQKNSTLSRNVEEGVTMFYASASSRSMTNGWQLELNFCSI